MEHVQSLDELIARKAAEFADQMRQAAAMADTEADIRTEAVRQLAFIEKEAGVKLEGRHEFTVASGRVDSVYDRVIIEYKNPSSSGDRIGPRAGSPGTKKVVEQIKKRFYDLRKEHGQPLNSLFGVGLDGNCFVFVRFRDDKWQPQEPVEVNKVSAERFLWALFNLGRKGKPFSAEYLSGDFGSEAKLAQDGIHTLYEAIRDTAHPKALVFFSQWKILFGEVCGYDVDNPSEKIKKLAQFYGVPLKGLKPAELLFAVHTYYALFMKLLASEIVGFFHRLPRPLERMMTATTSAKLRREIEELEKGSIFRHLNITNFLEGDLFAWYLPVWGEPVEKVIRDLVVKLDGYNPGTLSEDPAGSRDLLKKLYQQLFPKSVRHDLGEYYTPDWLAEHVLNELGYVGDPDKRILDPACGSGTFLVMAINRIKEWYDKNREKCVFGEDDLCRKILANVIGFDLNPLAVMAARTNYLIAIRDLIGHVDKVEIPVYLCDSVATPAIYGGQLFAGSKADAQELRTAAASFLIPVEVASDRALLTRYAEVLEDCVRSGHPASEFLQRCQDEGLPVAAHKIHLDLYRQLVALDKANKNGVWARIIKNSFAPLFVGRTVDFVAGNPPWVNYENLPADYREASAPVWEKYGLFPKGGWRARFAKGNTELAMLFVYACMDDYCLPHGKLSFVTTQSVFQSKDAGRGFRRFQISTEKPIRVLGVHDFTAIQPFEGAVNRTAVMTADMKGVTQYPLPYTVWSVRGDASFDSTAPLEQVKRHTTREGKSAAPVGDAQSPWSIMGSAASLSVLQAVTKGSKNYRAWKGADTRGGNGILWLQMLENTKSAYLCRNTPEFSKKKPPQKEWSFEKERVFPLLRGKETRRWATAPTLYIIFPHEGDHAIPEPEMRRRFPKTYAYFHEMREYLERRKMYDLSRHQLVFYSLFETGSFLTAPFKMVWKYIASELTCAVLGPLNDATIQQKVIIPDHKLVVVPFEEPDPAHYLCAVLNSSVARFVAGTYVVGTQISTHILDYIKVPEYSSGKGLHGRLARLSQRCHDATAGGKTEVVAACEDEIDSLVGELWGLSRKELETAKSAARRAVASSEDEQDA